MPLAIDTESGEPLFEVINITQHYYLSDNSSPDFSVRSEVNYIDTTTKRAVRQYSLGTEINLRGQSYIVTHQDINGVEARVYLRRLSDEPN